ncbi:MAG: D-glycero-beta-D-manno-heptose 1-phosphate adenylyltransferase [Candidatus Omnitrophota bacterium]|nr:D-glycero-beta-D-manno-heptose 1-phosphate adenylyltransferase [Candidatus Omnitrophota bacterium]
MSAKTLDSKKLANLLKRLRSKGRRVVFTNGCFDILHVGHVDYLSKAKSLGDILVVGLNSDSSVKKIKGKGRPINNARDRAKVLSALSCVDYISVFGESTPERLIRQLKPDTLVKGGDWKIEDIVGGEFVKSHGGKVKRIPFVRGYSTTSLIKKIENI